MKRTHFPDASAEDLRIAIAIGGPGVLPDVFSQNHLLDIVEAMCGERRSRQVAPQLSDLGFVYLGAISWKLHGSILCWVSPEVAKQIDAEKKVGQAWRMLSDRLNKSC